MRRVSRVSSHMVNIRYYLILIFSQGDLKIGNLVTVGNYLSLKLSQA